MPVAWVSVVMCKCNYCNRSMVLNDYERKGKSMQNKLLCAEPNCLACYWSKWRVWLFEKLRSMLKGIYQAPTESRLLHFILGCCFFEFLGSIPADLYLQNQPRMRALARASTSSTSSSSAVPNSISLIRRQISISQASATSFSAGPQVQQCSFFVP